MGILSTISLFFICSYILLVDKNEAYSNYYFLQANGTSWNRSYVYKKYYELLKHKSSTDCLDTLFNKNNIKLIAIDMDGTLANDNGKIDDENIYAMKLAEKMGIKVIISTGRLHKYTENMFSADQIKKFKLKNMDGVYSHGAHIRIKGLDLPYRYFSESDLDLILYSLTHHDILKYAMFFTVNDAYVFNDDTYLEKYIYNEEINGVKSDIKYIRTLEKAYKPILLNKIIDIFRIGKIVSIEIYDRLYPEQAQFSILFTHLFKELEPNFRTYIPSSANKLVLSPINTSKLYAVDAYARIYDIHPNKVLAIGNDHNDVDLLAGSGYSVAVNNSTDSAKRVARCISTKSNNESAVYDIIIKVTSGKLS